jgi:predicted ATP-binding protein involved in virulence
MTMILERLHLNNFRGFESLCVPLDRYLNVFIGGNGSGKTAILDGIKLALAPIGARLPLERRSKIRLPILSDIRRTSEDRPAPFLRIDADALVDGSTHIAWGLTQFRDKSSTTRKEAPPGGRHLAQLHDYLDRIIDAYNENRPFTPPVFAFYGTTRAAGSRKPHLRESSRPRRPRRFAGLEGALESRVDFRDAVDWFDIFEQRELRDQRDRGHSKPLPALDAVRHAISLMIPGVSHPRIDGTTNRFVVDTRDPTGNLVTLHLDQLSDGYQVMLGVVMDFALRLALANPPEKPGDDVLASEAILCIDEVDLHLHPSWQQRVIPDLRRTFPNTQLILTTHSPQVATTVPSENLRILKGSQLFAAPAGTEGAEAQRLLEDAFLVAPRPHVPPAEDLKAYLRLIDERKWGTPEAVELRHRLDEWSQGQEPQLVEADLRIENMKWEAGL